MLLNFLFFFYCCCTDLSLDAPDHLIAFLSFQGDFNSLGSHNDCSWSIHLWTEHDPRCHGGFPQILNFQN